MESLSLVDIRIVRRIEYDAGKEMRREPVFEKNLSKLRLERTSQIHPRNRKSKKSSGSSVCSIPSARILPSSRHYKVRFLTILFLSFFCGVTSVVWSSDSSKLYSASDEFARVFDSVSGTELHRFEHNNSLFSVALSPKHDVLACVGDGVAQLWDTESYQPLGKPFSPEDSVWLNSVSFSRDGRYLAYGGDDNKITLWMVKDIAPELPFSPSFLEVDATNPCRGDDIEDGHDDPYNNFFQSPEPFHPLEAYGSSRPSQRRNLLSLQRLWNVFIPSRHGPPADQSIPMQPHIKRSFFARHTAPQPVIVSAARPKKRWRSRPLVPKNKNVGKENGNANAQATQPLSAAAQQPSATVPCPTPEEPSQAQPAPRPTQEDEFDYGCWGKFLHAVCRIPHPRSVAPAVRSATS